MSNRITVIGTIATAPRMIGGDPAKSLCTFRLASNERRYDREKAEWIDGPTNWFNVNVFRGLGDNANASFRIGDRVLCTGRLRVRRWENEEKYGTSVEIDAEALGHDVRWGVSRFEKRVQAKTEAVAAGDRAADAAAAAVGSPADTDSQPMSGFENPQAGVGGFGRAEPEQREAA